MRRGGLHLLSVVGVVVGSGPASAEKEDWNDVPVVIGRTTETTFFNRINVSCTRDRASPREADCEINQVTVSPPDQAKVSKELAGLDSQFGNKTDVAEIFKSYCRQEDAPATDPVNSAFRAKTTKACKTQDASAMKSALAWYTTEVRGHTCRLSLWNSERRRFSRVDKDTWMHTTQAGGPCNVSLVMTLWRRPGDEGPLWNYKQVRAAPPNAESELCKGIKDSTTEWGWLNPSLRPADCRYLEY